jgi:hypothetical protein
MFSPPSSFEFDTHLWRDRPSRPRTRPTGQRQNGLFEGDHLLELSALLCLRRSPIDTMDHAVETALNACAITFADRFPAAEDY